MKGSVCTGKFVSRKWKNSFPVCCIDSIDIQKKLEEPFFATTSVAVGCRSKIVKKTNHDILLCPFPRKKHPPNMVMTAFRIPFSKPVTTFCTMGTSCWSKHSVRSARSISGYAELRSDGRSDIFADSYTTHGLPCVRATQMLTTINFFYHNRALYRQTEGSGLAQTAACLSGRQSHFNELQYAHNVSHKMISFKNAFLLLIYVYMYKWQWDVSLYPIK